MVNERRMNENRSGQYSELVDKEEPPSWTRREFLKKAGASILLLSVGGLLWRAVDQGVFSTGQGPAYEPWSIDDSTSLSESLTLVHSAILASNPHNTQPWLFRVAESSIEVFADEKRNLGAIDPLRREMQIGLGCALENLILAAEFNSYHPLVTYYPDPSDPFYVAKVELVPGNKKDSPLYDAIPNRHTHRGAYDTSREVAEEMLLEMEELCKDEPNVKLTWLTSPEQKQLSSELTILATESIIADREMSDDSNKWYRHNWKHIQTYRDGLTLDVQGGPLWLRAMGKMLPATSNDSANKFWLNATRDTYTKTAAAYGLLAVKDFSNKEQRIRSGRIWQRIHLHGTVHGLAMHPLNQPVEMRDRELQLGKESHFGEKLKELMNHSDWEVLFLFRIGYAHNDALPSPRRALNDVLCNP